MRIGLLEIAVVVVVACLVMGPEKTKDYARVAGKALKILKSEFDVLKSEVEEATKEVKGDFSKR